MYKLACLAARLGLSATTFAHTDKHKWEFEKYNCVFGCDPSLHRLLTSELGNLLDLKNPTSGFSLFNECNGTLSLKVSRSPVLHLIKSLNQTLPVSKRFTKQNAGLNKTMANTGYAICTEANGSNRSTFWILDLSTEEMLIYYEGETILHFKKKAAAF